MNPFEVLDREARIGLFVLPGPLRRRLGEPWDLLEVVGPADHGKSTSLLLIEETLRRRGEEVRGWYVPPDDPRLPDAQARWLLVDEAQRLEEASVVAWLVDRAARGLRTVFGTHERLREVPVRRAIHELRPWSPRQLRAALNRRIERLAPDCPRRLTAGGARFLARRFGGDLERIRAVCYLAFMLGRGDLDEAALEEAAGALRTRT